MRLAQLEHPRVDVFPQRSQRVWTELTSSSRFTPNPSPARLHCVETSSAGVAADNTHDAPVLSDCACGYGATGNVVEALPHAAPTASEVAVTGLARPSLSRNSGSFDYCWSVRTPLAAAGISSVEDGGALRPQIDLAVVGGHLQFDNVAGT